MLGGQAIEPNSLPALGVIDRSMKTVSADRSLADWIMGDAIPFGMASQAFVDSAVDGVYRALGDNVRLLGLGEGLHGGEDVLQLRNRFFERLVATHGFSAIALESSYLKGCSLNNSISSADAAGLSGAGLEAACSAGMSHGFGALEANHELITWMHDYNQDPAHPGALRLYGFDGPMEMWGTDSPRMALGVVLDYLEAVGSPVAARRGLIEDLIGSDAAWENPAAMMDPGQAVGGSEAARSLRIETEDLMLELEVRRPDWIRRSSVDRYEEVRQHARVARQLLGYHAALATAGENRTAHLLGLRDALMADCLAYAVRRERGRGRVLVYAHNRHLQKGPATWQLGPTLLTWWPAGAHLAQRFGTAYAVIGSSVGVSPENGIGAPEPGSLEARLGRGRAEGLFIPTHGGQGLSAAEIQALPTRTGSVRNPMYMPWNADAFTDFDALAYLPTTTYARGAPTLP